MAPRKRRRTCVPRRPTATTTSSPEPNDATPSPALPVDVLVTIAERTDAATIVRCAAACKALRREIVRPEFTRRVCQEPDAIVPSRVLGCLGAETFSPVHPFTVPAFSFAENYLAPFVSRSRLAQLLDKYTVVNSRGGLVALKRRGVSLRRRRTEMCVYDPMTGDLAFLPAPPDIGEEPYDHELLVLAVFSYVLLTAAADGIGCPFMLLAADMTSRFDGSNICPRFQTVSSDAGGEWGPINSTEHHCPRWCSYVGSYCDAAVVLDGVVHWLMHASAGYYVEGEVREYILTYDVATATVGSVDLPRDRHVVYWSGSKLGSSPDGKLSLTVTDWLVVSVWVLSSSGGGHHYQWARHVEIDMMEMDLMELWTEEEGARSWVKVESFGDQRSGTVFLRIGDDPDTLLVLDMETGRTSMRWLHHENPPGPAGSIPYEVDLASRLSSMKAF